MHAHFKILSLKVIGLISREEGQDLVEYGLVLALVSVGAIAVLGDISGKVVGYYTFVVAHLP